MLQPTTTRRIQLAKREMLSLDSQARQVVCESGSVWITQDRDTQDILLEPGELFNPEPGRRAIVYALSPALLTVRNASGAAVPATVRAPAARPSRHTLVLE